MTFNSYTFAVFFLIVLGLHCAPLPWRLKKVNHFGPCPSLLDYAPYVTFLPHPACGPIIHAADLLPQLTRPRQASRGALACSLQLMVLGLFQNAALADGLFAPIVERVYDAAVPASFRDAWTGTLAFAGQIYCDFAGCLITAVSCAHRLGFWLPINFRAPCAAVGLLIAAGLACVLVASVELLWRSRGHVPCVTDDKGLWTIERSRIPARNPNHLVIVGNSHSALGLPLDELRRLHPGLGLTQLSTDGTAPGAVLADLAGELVRRGVIAP